MRPLHINLVAFLAVFVSVTVDAQYPVTYGCVAQILAYSPMNKLNTVSLSRREIWEFQRKKIEFQFVTNLNKDATLAAKKKRANSWVPNNLVSTVGQL